jgi:hypothetical protein
MSFSVRRTGGLHCCTIVALLLLSGCAAGGAAQSGSAMDAIAGFYEGTIVSRQHGAVEVSANLRVEEGQLIGTLVTPLGDFPLTAQQLSASAVTLHFSLGDGEIAVIDLARSDGGLVGSWRMSGDGGSVDLRRAGAPRPPLQPGGSLTLPAAAWREDLRYLASQLPRRHGNAFHTVSRSDFDVAIRDLDQRIDALAPHEIVAALGRVVAMIGDGHTYVQTPATFHRFPIRLYDFDDGLRITRVTAGSEQLLGGRVVAIAGIAIDEARRRVEQQIARENEQYVRKEIAGFLTYAEYLHANGVISDFGEAEWTIETLQGDRAAVRLTPVAPDAPLQWARTAPQTPLRSQRPDEDLWFTVLPDVSTLYVNFRGYPARKAFREQFEQVLKTADEQQLERLVIDLRQNSGGDFTKFRDLFLPKLKRHRLNEQGRLYVAIGRFTFSAAMTNAADLLRETEAILIGEPTGARPNGWQERGQLRLPRSGLIVSVSTRYYRFLDDDLPAVIPHVKIPLTIDDLLAGRDPLLEWIESQPSPP